MRVLLIASTAGSCRSSADILPILFSKLLKNGIFEILAYGIIFIQNCWKNNFTKDCIYNWTICLNAPPPSPHYEIMPPPQIKKKLVRIRIFYLTALIMNIFFSNSALKFGFSAPKSHSLTGFFDIFEILQLKTFFCKKMASKTKEKSDFGHFFVLCW